MQRNCDLCGKSYKPVKSGRSKYCSNDCKKSVANAKLRKLTEEKIKNIICKVCETEFRQTSPQNTSYCIPCRQKFFPKLKIRNKSES